ncbi:MAG: pseudouridine synthase [Bacteroidota bacterium]|nr:pseudouridine synthase [Bacteroidota bacterium]
MRRFERERPNGGSKSGGRKEYGGRPARPQSARGQRDDEMSSEKPQFDRKPAGQRDDERSSARPQLRKNTAGTGRRDDGRSSERTEGGRPSFGKKPFGNRSERPQGGKPSFGRRDDERSSERTEGGRPSFGKKPFGNRSERPQGEKPSFGKRDFGKGPGRPQFAKGNRDNEGATDRPWRGTRPSAVRRSGSATKEKRVDDGSMRLNRYLANAGICSRREADTYIQAGVVTINGNVISELGSRVNPGDQVRFNNELLSPERKVYLLLNKPKGFVTTTDDPHASKTVMDLVQDACHERIYPVGRLDKGTTGVLLLTNDGEMAKRLTHPKYKCKKIYQAYLDKRLDRADLLKIAEGVELEDGYISADSVQYIDPEDKKLIGLEIHSGKNRIVRRIFEHLGYKVEKLDRVMFAGLTKSKLPRGKWRFLTEKEIAFLKMGNF